MTTANFTITSAGPTNKGWTCPVCGAGVNPDQKTCPHDQQQTFYPLYYPSPSLPPPVPPYYYTTNLPYTTRNFNISSRPMPCDACRNGGVCNCVLSGPVRS